MGACLPQLSEGSGSDAADARLGEADTGAYLAQRELARVGEHDDAPLERRQPLEGGGHTRPARVGPRGRSGLRRHVRVTELGQAVERDLDVGLRQILGKLLLFAEGAALGARERVAVAERVEHLAAHTARGIRAERRAEIAAVTARGLDEAEDTPRDEVLAVRAAAARVERTRGDGPCESQVRDDAFLDGRSFQRSPSSSVRTV